MRTPSNPFSDVIAQADGITITLNCGLCNQPAGANHACVKTYLRAARVVQVRCLADASSSEPDDLFLVQLQQGGEEYTTTRAVLERDYQEI